MSQSGALYTFAKNTSNNMNGDMSKLIYYLSEFFIGIIVLFS